MRFSAAFAFTLTTICLTGCRSHQNPAVKAGGFI